MEKTVHKTKKVRSLEIKESGGAINSSDIKDPGNTGGGQREENRPDPKVIWIGKKCLLWFWVVAPII